MNVSSPNRSGLACVRTQISNAKISIRIWERLMSERLGFEGVAVVDMPGVDRGLCECRSCHQRGEHQGGDEGLHGNLLCERCQTIRRYIDKISRQPAGTIKLPFRKLNSISWERFGGRAALICASSPRGGAERRENPTFVGSAKPRRVILAAGAARRSVTAVGYGLPSRRRRGRVRWRQQPGRGNCRNGCARVKLSAIEDVDIRRAEGAARRIDATEISPCCRPGNLG